MTAKEKVREVFPTAKSERQVKGKIKGAQEVYYLIRPRYNQMYIGSGKTEILAWKDVVEKYEL